MANDEQAPPRSHLRLVGGTDVAARLGTAQPPSEPPRPGVSLMMTRQQKERLRALGFTDETIKTMTPAEAHRHLGL